MALYRVKYKPSIDKNLRSIPSKDLKKIVKCIQDLAGNPRPYGCEQLFGKTKFRVRQGDYRILYIINDIEHIVRVIKVGHRRDVYLAREKKTEYNAAGMPPKNKT
jgi:mRNA interferase RelE/StbE